MDPTLATKENKKKSRKKITLILVITGILALASIATAYLYFQINDLSPQETKATDGCACYFVLGTDTVQSCSDTDYKSAFQFQTGNIINETSCSVTCNTNEAAPLSNSGATPTILSCKINDFPAEPGCVDISLSQVPDKRVANVIDPSKKLNITAKFDTPSNATGQGDFFSSFVFSINGTISEFQVAQATSSGTGTDKKYEVVTSLEDFSDVDNVTVQAFAKTITGATMTSDACHRTVSVYRATTASCTELSAEVIRNTSNVPKVVEVALTTAAISTPSTLSVKFTVGSQNEVLTTKNIANLLSGNSLVLNQTFLYTASNFLGGESFSVLDNSTDSIAISAVIYVNGVAVPSSPCTGSFAIPAQSGDSDPTDDEEPTDDETPTDDEEPTDDETPTEEVPTDTSNFTTTKAVSAQCAERTTPLNTIYYTIRIKNDDTDTEILNRVEDKLPLGFTYIPSTTYIDNVAVSDSSYVTLTQVGNSQQVTFQKSGGWSVAPAATLTIKFYARVGSTALSGSNLNEVVAVPARTPANSTTVRTSRAITVAQTCTAPDTGLFDSAAAKIILGVFIFILGLFLYYSQSGLDISQKFLTWGPVSSSRKSINTLKLKISDPRKYFEEKIIDKASRKKD